MPNPIVSKIDREEHQREILLCSKCNAAPHEGWPDGTPDPNGLLCQMCWEKYCDLSFWATFGRCPIPADISLSIDHPPFDSDEVAG